MKQKIIVAGSGGYTSDIYETALLLGYEVLILNPLTKSLFNDEKIILLEEVTEELLLLPIITSSVNYPEYSNLSFDKEEISSKKKLVDQIESMGFKNWTSIIHPSTSISTSAKLAVNVFVNANSTISSNSSVSKNTIINRNVSIGHDISIGSLCTISPGVTITSMVRIQDSVFVGAGAIITNGVAVGSGATVAAGSVVTRDVMSLTLVMGTPARPTGYLTRGKGKKMRLRTKKILKIPGLSRLCKRIQKSLNS
jgi:acetyltransferase-like isoleucine patch superfamily enzyme